eukprot:SAG25_NODE_332_length_9639_cov_3.140776_7_plen_124_part_00
MQIVEGRVAAAEAEILTARAAAEAAEAAAAAAAAEAEAAEAEAEAAVGAVLAHDQGCERREKRLLCLRGAVLAILLRRRARHPPATVSSFDPHGASITTPQSITGSPRPHGGRPQVRCSTCIG